MSSSGTHAPPPEPPKPPEPPMPPIPADPPVAPAPAEPPFPPAPPVVAGGASPHPIELSTMLARMIAENPNFRDCMKFSFAEDHGFRMSVATWLRIAPILPKGSGLVVVAPPKKIQTFLQVLFEPRRPSVFHRSRRKLQLFELGFFFSPR